MREVVRVVAHVDVGVDGVGRGVYKVKASSFGAFASSDMESL